MDAKNGNGCITKQFIYLLNQYKIGTNNVSKNHKISSVDNFAINKDALTFKYLIESLFFFLEEFFFKDDYASFLKAADNLCYKYLILKGC